MNINISKKQLLSIIILLIIIILPASIYSAQQYQGVCAKVKIEILQELTLERIGFLASLEITNNEGDAPITNFSAKLTFENLELSDDETNKDSSSLFFVKPPELNSINSIDGTGIIPPSKKATISWFIIPKIDAGGKDADGITYLVGADLAGSIYGNEIEPETLEVIADTIVVKPDPQLVITYFQPRDVDGDDPFTMDIVEKPVPFLLGVLVKNDGYGMARNVQIESQQPTIINPEGLIIVAQLLGSRIDDQPTNENSLTVNIGNIEPGKCRKGSWDMITSLSGEFVEFNASFTHASELGGEETSIIKEMNAFFISHEVLNDEPGRDDLLDFLADTDDDSDMLPDTLYESDCNVLPVNYLNQATSEAKGFTTVVNVLADREGWVYIRVDDPFQAKFQIESVYRSDGKLLNINNYWSNIRYHKTSNQKLTYLNIFDFVDLGDYQYNVSYRKDYEDNDPPETKIRFAGNFHQVENKFYILPETRVYFTVEDASPVATYLKSNNDEKFLPAYPFYLTEAGNNYIHYYSEDNSGNKENIKTTQIILASEEPKITSLNISDNKVFLSNNHITILPNIFKIGFQGSTSSTRLDAAIDIFKGILEPVTNKEGKFLTSTSEQSITPSNDYDFSNLKQVRHLVFENIGSEYFEYEWDLKDDSGYFADSGWYTIRLKIYDELERSAISIKTIHIEDVLADISYISPETIQKNSHAFGELVVWQDMKKGNWDIFGLDLTDYNSSPITLTTNKLNQENPGTDGQFVVWEDFKIDGTTDISGIKSGESSMPFNVTETPDINEKNPVVFWPWVVFQSKSASNPDTAWQIKAKNMLTNTLQSLDPTTEDQLDPAIYNGKVVWQDFRDPGYGEIYFKDLETGIIKRITNSHEGQYHPVIYENLIVWSDKRNTQHDLYSYDLIKNKTLRMTNTEQNETRPFIYDKWIIFESDSLDGINTNIAIMYMKDLTTIELTHYNSIKQKPCMTNNKIFWQDNESGMIKIKTGTLPLFQEVYNNTNSIIITQSMVDYQKDAFTLLKCFNNQAKVRKIIQYNLKNNLINTKTAEIIDDKPDGDNFALIKGNFLWIKFDQNTILSLGIDNCNSIDLLPGANIISYSCFPKNFTANKLMTLIGLENVNAVRILDSKTGRWKVLTIIDGQIFGDNFYIPEVSVVMIDMKIAINDFQP